VRAECAVPGAPAAAGAQDEVPCDPRPHHGWPQGAEHRVERFPAHHARAVTTPRASPGAQHAPNEHHLRPCCPAWSPARVDPGSNGLAACPHARHACAHARAEETRARAQRPRSRASLAHAHTACCLRDAAAPPSGLRASVAGVSGWFVRVCVRAGGRAGGRAGRCVRGWRACSRACVIWAPLQVAKSVKSN